MNCLVCSVSGLGNALTAIPLIRALTHLGHEVSVRCAESRGTRALFQRLDVVKSVFTEKDAVPQLDAAFCTHVCAEYHRGCRCGRSVYMIEPGLLNADQDSIERYTKHEIEHNLDLARALGFTGQVPPLRLPTECVPGAELGSRAVNLMIGYYKGDATSRRKHWGNANFARLAELLELYEYTPVMIVGPGDEEDARQIVERSKAEIRVFEGLTLFQVFGLLGQCAATVGNETMLVPASFGLTKCVSLVFHDAIHNARKTYPYPDGTAVVGPREEITPEVAFDQLEMKLEGREHGRVYVVGQGQEDLSADSPCACVRIGYGRPPPRCSFIMMGHSGSDDPMVMKNMRRLIDTAPDSGEVILVGNRVEGRLAEWLDSLEGALVLQSNRNLGVVAKNFAYNAAQGEYIFSVDSDVWVEGDWYRPLLEFLETHGDVGLVGPCGARLRDDEWTREQWPCGEFEGPVSAVGYEDTTFFGGPSPTAATGIEVDVVPSMVWAFRRELLGQIGYLDWRFGPFVGSDSDFCLRAKEGGWRICVVRAPVHHRGGGGFSHSCLHDLDELRRLHVAALYDEWRSRFDELCFYGKHSDEKE